MSSRDWQSVPIPEALAARPRDTRGFPITFITKVDSDGRPDFTVLDEQAMFQVVQHVLCGLCGTTLRGQEALAFIGGPISVENQMFSDPWMHVECAEYALQVCPHLAISTSRYSKPSEGATVNPYVSTERPDRVALYVTNGAAVTSCFDQLVFAASPPKEVRWSDDA